MFQRAVVQDRLGNSETALQELTDLIQKNPKFAKAYDTRASMYAKTGQLVRLCAGAGAGAGDGDDGNGGDGDGDDDDGDGDGDEVAYFVII